MIEEWKYIEEYENNYMISNMGRIKKFNQKYDAYIIVKSHHNKSGYLVYNFNYNGKNSTKFIHRIVAQYFIPNPNNLPIVNHINENKGDARYFNLEWCTHRYNTNAGTVRTRIRKTLMANADVSIRPVILMNTGEFFGSVNRASEETGIDIEDIMRSCKDRIDIYDDKTFHKSVMFLYYEEVKSMIKDKYDIEVEIE